MKKANITVIDLTTEPELEPETNQTPEVDTHDAVTDAADNDKCQLFILKGKVVGKRYYSGSMNDREMVYLVREPENPYDRNAIKVESITHQQGKALSLNTLFSCAMELAVYLHPATNADVLCSYLCIRCM